MRRKTDAEKLDALNRQYKQKNKYIAANYDRIGIVTPKGTRDYIKSLGMSANSYINGLIEADRRRREAAEDPEHNPQESRQEGPDAKPQEAPQGTPPGARTNRHEATKSATEGHTEAQEATTSAGTAEGSLQEEPKPRGRSSNRGQREKASGANKSPQETTGGPEEGTTAGSSTGSSENTTAGSSEDAQPVEAAEAPQPITPGDNLQDMLLYPYGTHDDIPPEELPFH